MPFRRFSLVIPLTLVPLLFASFAGVCAAPQPPPEPDLQQRIPLADLYLQERLGIWETRFGLSGWNISLIQTKPSDLRAGTIGNIHWDMDAHEAEIRVVRANSYKAPYSDALADMEETMVHELIHLKMASVSARYASTAEEEQAVNRLTASMLKLDQRR